MDGDRFDAIVKALGSGADRRRALGGLLGGTLALLAGPAAATERHQRRGAQRANGGKGGNRACAEFCHAVFGDSRAAGQCTAQAAKGRGLCHSRCGPVAPDAGHKLCGTRCVELGTDANCGDCGDACTGGKTCGGGGTPNVCGSAAGCPTGRTDCDGSCKDLQTDGNNCGACDVKCGQGKTCCRGSCTDTQTDPANCGTCFNRCPSGTCQGGACCATTTCGSLTCPAGADICTTPVGSPSVSCGSGTVSCFCTKVNGASTCGSITCQPCDPAAGSCVYSSGPGGTTVMGTCIACTRCASATNPGTTCFKAYSA